jgi:hypothetical protein
MATPTIRNLRTRGNSSRFAAKARTSTLSNEPLSRGRYGGGRPAKLTEDDLDVARTLLANPDITVDDVADRIGVSLLRCIWLPAFFIR